MSILEATSPAHTTEAPITFAENLLQLAERLEAPGAEAASATGPVAEPEPPEPPEPAAAAVEAPAEAQEELPEEDAPDAYEPPALDAAACERTFPVLNPRCHRNYLEQFRALRTRLTSNSAIGTCSSETSAW